MVNIDDIGYKAIAEALLSAIDDAEFYNGSVEYDTAEYGSRLTATLIIYREPLLDPADPARCATRITGIVPVWWEFHTYGERGEILNGFSWSELRNFLI